MEKENIKVLISKEQIFNRVRGLGSQITADYQGKEVVVICMLKGGAIFCADLIREVKIPLKLDFARISSYGNNTVGGDIKVLLNIGEDIKDKEVLIVDDIIDSGRTLQSYVELLKANSPKSIKLCALLDKKQKRVCDISVDYVGFEIEDKFVVGYGMDYAERYRELDFIGVIEE